MRRTGSMLEADGKSGVESREPSRPTRGGARMKFFTGILFGFFLTGLVIAAYLATGSYDVSAAKKPSKMEARIASFALNKSVARRAPNTKNPQPGSAETWAGALPHYKEMCVTCHGAPGVDASEIGEGL